VGTIELEFADEDLFHLVEYPEMDTNTSFMRKLPHGN
jgi:hypothetical protein